MNLRRLRLLLASWLVIAGTLTLAPARASAQDGWNGAFSTGFSFFVGGGAGGGLARLQLQDEAQSRYAVTVPLNLRAGFDIGRYGLAVMLDTQYTFCWGPANDQGPTPIERHGRFEWLSMLGAVLWRTPSPFYLVLGAGASLTSQGQNLLVDPAPVRAEILAGLGFIYRFERKGDNVAHYPFGMSASFESRFYVPWDDHFLSWSLQVVLTFYFVFSGT